MSRPPPGPYSNPWRAAAVGAGLWLVAHLVVHGVRGWPTMPVPGEWDVLLPAAAYAAGEVPEVWRRGLQAVDGGLLLEVRLVGFLLALGFDPTLLARLLAMGLGAVGAGALSLLGARAAPHHAGRATWVTGVVVAGTLPFWHHMAAGLPAATPEAVGLGLSALGLLVWRVVDGGEGAGAEVPRAVAAGALLGVAAVLSPAVAPVGVAAGVLALGSGWRATVGLVAGGLVSVGVVGGAAGPFDGGLGSLLTSGVEDGSGGSPFVVVPAGMFAASGGLTDELVFPVTLGLFTLLTLLVALTSVVNPGPVRAAALGVAATVGMMTVAPAGYGEYPEAYRYWQVGLLMAAVAYAALFVKGRRWWLALAVPVVLFVLGPGQQRSSRLHGLDDSLFHAGAHRMNADPWGDQALFAELVPHAPREAAPELGLGYGLEVGLQVAGAGMEAPFVNGAWQALMGEVEPDVAFGLNLGVGYALGACALKPDSLAALRARPVKERAAVFRGLGRGYGDLRGAVRLAEVAEVEEDADVWAEFGAGFRAAGGDVTELMAESEHAGGSAVAGEVRVGGIPLRVLEAIRRGASRPGGGRWETRLMDELRTLVPPGCGG